MNRPLRRGRVVVFKLKNTKHTKQFEKALYETIFSSFLALLLSVLILSSCSPDKQNHLVAFTNGLANVRWDSLKDGIILSTKFLLGDAGSAVSTGARDVASAAQGCGVGGSNDSSSSTGTAVAIGNEFGAVSGGISEFKGIVDTRGVSLRPPEKERSLKSPEGIQQVSLR